MANIQLVDAEGMSTKQYEQTPVAATAAAATATPAAPQTTTDPAANTQTTATAQTIQIG